MSSLVFILLVSHLLNTAVSVGLLCTAVHRGWSMWGYALLNIAALAAFIAI